jgi:hypothetical protein
MGSDPPAWISAPRLRGDRLRGNDDVGQAAGPETSHTIVTPAKACPRGNGGGNSTNEGGEFRRKGVIPAQAGISLSHCSVILGLRPVCVRCPHRQARGSINYFIYTSYSFFTTKTIISLFAHPKRKRKRAPIIPHMSNECHTRLLFFVTPPSSRHTDKKFIASLL